MSSRVYQVADGLRAQVDALVQQHHPHLAALEVRIDLLWAYSGSERQPMPTLMVRGQPVAGLAAIEPLKRRAQGFGDARIEIDLGVWQTLEDDIRLTLLDHELEHLEPVVVDRKPQFDTLDRPRLRIRQHDVEIGVFATVAARHGSRSIEVQDLLSLFTGAYGAALFPGEFGAGREHQAAVTAGRAMPALEFLTQQRFDVAELRRGFEAHHAKQRRARELRDSMEQQCERVPRSRKRFKHSTERVDGGTTQ